MALPYPPQDHHIALADAVKMTKAFQQSQPVPPHKAVAFNREIIDEILKQDGCEGIRCYFALTATGELTLVIAGVDGKGNDMYTGTLAELGWWCPPWCDDTVVSNSPLA